MRWRAPGGGKGLVQYHQQHTNTQQPSGVRRDQVQPEPDIVVLGLTVRDLQIAGRRKSRTWQLARSCSVSAVMGEPRRVERQVLSALKSPHIWRPLEISQVLAE
ncbi:hypothetical protein DPEC_G00328390 [Dallia pectoralis]|uniref:Uncharacterized protein n=1 Tax=Dallia pectoralis TaxID=75939 RepID=A0ACC2F897_DALPE|nr:hypothetical protein DPEC_G00328390 [Dallia pectoralis]